jgi:hypothetical protein
MIGWWSVEHVLDIMESQGYLDDEGSAEVRQFTNVENIKDFFRYSNWQTTSIDDFDELFDLYRAFLIDNKLIN